MALQTVHEHPVCHMERVSKRPLPPALRKALASNLSEKHQAALLEWVEGVVRNARSDGAYDAAHEPHDPDPFDW